MPQAVPLARVVRDGFAESVHHGHVAVHGPDGALGGLGHHGGYVYPRSAIKPFQAAATIAALAEHGAALAPSGIAIAAGSHGGSATHQVEAAYLLARAGLDESALRCPAALPMDGRALADDPHPTRLAHNCSGKHAAFLLAHTRGRRDRTGYLEPTAPVQERVREVLARLAGGAPQGPGVDGCGAPAWRLPLEGVARAFACLATATAGPLAAVREAMAAEPHLVGGASAFDTALMRALPGLVAKRGAEGLMAAGWLAGDGAWGIAVKIEDGAGRAAGPVVASVLAELVAPLPEGLRFPPVLGGGEPHGRIEPTDPVAKLPRRLR